MPRKSDADEIAEFIDELPGELRLDARRSWWPQFVFRFDDVRNVVSILRRRAVLSREQCHNEGLAHHDAANQAVIEATSHAHRFVRLFFRPLTPTQYRMEGIKAASELTATKEHCPVPVFLLFDSKSLLAEQGVAFSDGSLARRGRYAVGEDVDFLRTIPFESVYHDGAVYGDQAERREITFRRHAEVFVENQLGLQHLRRILCRTGPERDTLLHLLGSDADRYESLIRIAPPGTALFYRTGMFVESIHMVNDRLYFRMPSRGNLVYAADLKVVHPETGKLLAHHTRADARLNGAWDFSLGRRHDRVLLTFVVEGAVAFQGIISQRAIFGAQGHR